MAHRHYRVSVEVLENGFKVEVPDLEAVAKAVAAAKKAKQPDPYCGDCNKSYAAKTVKEVIKLVTTSLEGLADDGYDAAFNEASKAT